MTFRHGCDGSTTRVASWIRPRKSLIVTTRRPSGDLGGVVSATAIRRSGLPAPLPDVTTGSRCRKSLILSELLAADLGVLINVSRDDSR
jgi:hypothetical protein